MDDEKDEKTFDFWLGKKCKIHAKGPRNSDLFYVGVVLETNKHLLTIKDIKGGIYSFNWKSIVQINDGSFLKDKLREDFDSVNGN